MAKNSAAVCSTCALRTCRHVKHYVQRILLAKKFSLPESLSVLILDEALTWGHQHRIISFLWKVAYRFSKLFTESEFVFVSLDDKLGIAFNVKSIFRIHVEHTLNLFHVASSAFRKNCSIT